MSVAPMLLRPFVGMGCSMGHHRAFDPRLPVYSPSGEEPKTHFEFDSDINHFFIKQESQRNIPGSRTDVRGKVLLRSTDKEHTSVHFDINASDKELCHNIKIQPQKEGIVFKADPWSLLHQYVNVTVNVYIPTKANFKGLYVGTRELNIETAHKLGDSIEKVGFESVSGHIYTKGKQGDATYADWQKVRTVSGNIKGGYSLVRGLDIASVSGNVDVEVYHTDNEEEKAYLKVKTASGKSNIHVVHPMYSRHLYSKIYSVSGPISLRLPEGWQGTMKLTSTSGLFTVDGKNIEVVKKKKTIKGMYLKFIKGDEGLGFGKIGSVSGDIKASVGDV